MQIKNLDAAKRLVEKYESITREELESNAREDEDLWHNVLFRITGFGSLKKCCLCKECYNEDSNESSNPNCTKCLYSWNTDSVNSWSIPCVGQDTYRDICDAESLDELYEAIQNRADFIENLIKEIENDN